MIQYLSSKGVPFKNMHLRCQSIGSGAGFAIAEKYPLGSAHFIVPFAKIHNVFERNLEYMPKALRPVARFFVSSTLSNYFEYDNLAKIKKCKIQKIAIDEAAEGAM